MTWSDLPEPPAPEFSAARLWATALLALAIVVGWAVWTVWFFPAAVRGW